MPTIAEVEGAARRVAADCGHWRSLSPAKFYGTIIPLLQRRPEDFGFPKSWSERPNWDKGTLCHFMARALWDRQFHPQAEAARRWRGLPWTIIARLCAGDDPRMVIGAGRDINHAEAAAILDAAAWNRRCGGSEWDRWVHTPLTWFTRHLPWAQHYLPRSRLLADWLVAKKGWRGWTQPMPVGYGPDGGMRTIEPALMLDEVWDQDLVNGVSTSPERVFRAVLDRTSAEALQRLVEFTQPFPAMPWTTIPGIEQIRTGKDLVMEGQRMSNCVAGYAESCRQGQCYILSLPGSTAEVRPDGSVYQHLGHKNHKPPASDQALLDRWVMERRKSNENRD